MTFPHRSVAKVERAHFLVEHAKKVPTAKARFGVATEPWQLDGLDEEAVTARRLGHDVQVLDGAAGARAELDSPRWVGGLKYTTGNGTPVHPRAIT